MTSPYRYSDITKYEKLSCRTGWERVIHSTDNMMMTHCFFSVETIVTHWVNFCPVLSIVALVYKRYQERLPASYLD